MSIAAFVAVWVGTFLAWTGFCRDARRDRLRGWAGVVATVVAFSLDLAL